MRIRDTGSTVEFWLKSSSSSVFMYGKEYSFTTPNGNGSGDYDYPSGAEWKKIASKVVTDSGNVTFRIENTGAEYFGGPTSHTAYINRATVPDAPSTLYDYDLGYTVAKLTFNNPGASNGSKFEGFQWQVSSTPQSGRGNFVGKVEITESTTKDVLAVSDLVPGVVYDWHVRQKSNLGYGPWSGIASFQMLWGAWVRYSGTWRKATVHVKRSSSGAWHRAIPYVYKQWPYNSWTLPDKDPPLA